jgi:magnesium chelatase family protein
MVSRVFSFAYEGIDVKPIEVQVQIAPGLPCVNIVGLADKSVAESRDRIRAAFHSLALSFPQKRVIVNLAPADIHKDGSHYDLAIALGLLAEMKIIEADALKDYCVMGELSLDGKLNSVSGVLPASIAANAEGKGIICPKQNGGEATWSGNKSIIAPVDLLQLINHLTSKQAISYPEKILSNANQEYPDLIDIKGHYLAKRALEIAAAGGHNMLMIGPPGSGKSMLAQRLPGILPALSHEEMLETSIIASVAGVLGKDQLVTERPFRAPHNSASMASIVGGGRIAKPGEVTLAHRGVLFLDELPQFSSNVLEALRQPIEDGKVTISRVNSHITYPARFQMIAAMNPCKCGNFGDANNMCSKAPRCAEDYQSQISGPLFDRFDLRVDVVAIDIFGDEKQTVRETSEMVAKRVSRARELQLERYKDQAYNINSEAQGDVLEKYIAFNSEARDIMKKAADKFSLSMRGYIRILRVARTIADLSESENIEAGHLAEALSFRISKLRA